MWSNEKSGQEGKGQSLFSLMTLLVSATEQHSATIRDFFSFNINKMAQ